MLFKCTLTAAIVPAYDFFSRAHLGEAIVAYATPTESNTEDEDELVKELRLLVRSEIGPFAAPDVICITPSLPMVSSDIFQLLVLLEFYTLIYLLLSPKDEEWKDHETSFTQDFSGGSRPVGRCQYIG